MALIDNPNAIYLANALYAECYKTQKLDKNNLCAICGNKIPSKAGQIIGKVIYGFSHRPNESPILCYSHSIGWSVSANQKFNLHPKDFTLDNNEEVNLWFANYLAKTLIKLSKLKEKVNG